jgi:hypothetical protein
LARALALLTSKLFFSSSAAIPESCLATLFTFACRRGIGTPSTRLRRRLEISARPARVAAVVATAAAAAPFATVRAPSRALSAMASTVLPIEPAFSSMGARLFGAEVERARAETDAFFAELPLLLAVEREPALFLVLGVLGKASSWSTRSNGPRPRYVRRRPGPTR